MLDDIEELARIAVDCGLQVHRDFEPGLLETVYEIVLFEVLRDRGLAVERQLPVPITYRGMLISNALRADLLIERKLLIELKSTERHEPVHAKQLLTYLRLMELPLGLLMNFGEATFKEGVRRLANQYFRPIG